MDVLDRLIRDLPRFDASARAGVFGDDNVEHAQHLAWAEFGTTRGEGDDKVQHEPQRMTLTTVWDGAFPATMAGVVRGAQLLLAGKVSDGRTMLDAIAGGLAEAEREAIGANVPPPLATSTLAARRRRGNASTRTLVDRGDMQKAVSHESKDGGDGWPG